MNRYNLLKVDEASSKSISDDEPEKTNFKAQITNYRTAQKVMHKISVQDNKLSSNVDKARSTNKQEIKYKVPGLPGFRSSITDPFHQQQKHFKLSLNKQNQMANSHPSVRDQISNYKAIDRPQRHQFKRPSSKPLKKMHSQVFWKGRPTNSKATYHKHRQKFNQPTGSFNQKPCREPFRNQLAINRTSSWLNHLDLVRQMMQI